MTTVSERSVLRRPATTGRVGHVAALDGVRGIAVLAVLVYHLDLEVGGSPLLPGGFLGVSLFFTLSGYLITNLLVAEWESSGDIDLRRFWERRFRRLLPASLAGIVLALVLSPAWDADQLEDLPGDVLGALGYVANWRFIAAGDRYGAGFEEPSPLLHYWSLAIEEQFYLLVGVLTVVLAGASVLRRWYLVFGGLLAVSVVTTLVVFDPFDPERVYFGSLTRAAELLAGVLLALAVRMRIPARLAAVARVAAPIALAAMVAAFVFVDLDVERLYRGGLWLMAAASVVVVVGAVGGGPLDRLLTWPPLTMLGLVSYGVYVYHWPLFLWLDEDRTGLGPLGTALVQLLATAIVTTASFVALERPIREGRLPTRVGLGAAIAAAVVLVGGAWVAARDADARAVAGAAPAIQLAAVTTTTAPPATSTAPTTTVAPPPLSSVVILGDSLVEQAYPTVADRFTAAGIAIERIGAPGETLMTEQAAWLAEVVDAVDRVGPDVVLLESCCGTGNPRLPQPYVDESGVELLPDSDEIWAEWERLALAYTDAARADGALVFWILAPPAQTNGYYGPIEGRIAIANDIYTRIAACTPGVEIVDWSLLSGPDGGYAEALPDAAGELVTVRTPDGLHFTPAGQALLADFTRDVVAAGWDTAPRNEPTGSACAAEKVEAGAS